jgi:hypothetical protein
MTRRRSGFSLVIVLVLMSTLLLVAVAFTESVLQGARAARLGWQGERAAHEAETTLLRAVAAWSATSAAALRVGESDTVVLSAAQLVQRTRLQARLFSLDAWSRVHDGAMRPSERRIARVVRLDWPIIPALGALTVLGRVALDAGSSVLGADAVPAGWSDECETEARTTPVVAAAARDAVIDSLALVLGNGAPVRVLSPALTLSLGADFDASHAALVAFATWTTTDSVINTDALAADASGCARWFGDAVRGAGAIETCTRRWPIVHASHSGTVRLTGTRPVQGALVANGSVRIDPGVMLAGVLVVRGALQVHVPAGTQPVSITGAVVVRDELAQGSRLQGDVRVQSAQCPARLSLATAGRPAPVRQHGWSERP